MEGVILTKPNEIPADAVAAMIPACKVKLIEQLQLVRTPELDAFGHTAIENKGGATSVEIYIQGALAGRNFAGRRDIHRFGIASQHRRARVDLICLFG